MSDGDRHITTKPDDFKLSHFYQNEEHEDINRNFMADILQLSDVMKLTIVDDDNPIYVGDYATLCGIGMHAQVVSTALRLQEDSDRLDTIKGWLDDSTKKYIAIIGIPAIIVGAFALLKLTGHL